VVTPAMPQPFGETAARGLDALLAQLLVRGINVSCLVVTEESAASVDKARQRLHRLSGGERLDVTVFAPRRRPVLLRKLRSLRRPFSETLQAEGFAEALAARVAAGYDVLHLEQLWSGWVGLDRARTIVNVYQLEVLDWQGRRGLGLAERKALLQMRRATRRILKGSRHVRVVSRRLHERVSAMNPALDCVCVPFALDASHYPLQAPVAEPVIGLLGSMHWLPSRLAAERLITRIWPRVKRRVPRARLLVGGWNARRYLACHAGPDIELVDNLTHPREFFSRAAVLVYPSVRGTGVKVKVLEAMAYGVPVVTTGEGIEGLAGAAGVHCHVGEDDEALAERVVDLLGNAPERARLREAGRALVETAHAPARVADQMLDLYERVRRA
jgi:glycosyltransferase involved in cell wall biosynthesis